MVGMNQHPSSHTCSLPLHGALLTSSGNPVVVWLNWAAWGQLDSFSKVVWKGENRMWPNTDTGTHFQKRHSNQTVFVQVYPLTPTMGQVALCWAPGYRWECCDLQWRHSIQDQINNGWWANIFINKGFICTHATWFDPINCSKIEPHTLDMRRDQLNTLSMHMEM